MLSSRKIRRVYYVGNVRTCITNNVIQIVCINCGTMCYDSQNARHVITITINIVQNECLDTQTVNYT